MELQDVVEGLRCCGITGNCKGCPFANDVGCTCMLEVAALTAIEALIAENEQLSAKLAEAKAFIKYVDTEFGGNMPREYYTKREQYRTKVEEGQGK